MTKVISTTKAREDFAEIINRVCYAGDDFVIEKQGKPVAMITAVSDRLIKRTKSRKNDFLLKLMEYKAKGAPKDLAKNHDKYAWEE